MTKINGISQQQLMHIYATGKKMEETVNKPVFDAKDAAEISQKARELQAFRAKLEEVPDIREEKVREIQQQLENGRYQVDLDKLADNLLWEINLGVEKNGRNNSGK